MLDIYRRVQCVELSLSSAWLSLLLNSAMGLFQFDIGGVSCFEPV